MAAPGAGDLPSLRERDDEGHVVLPPEIAADTAPSPNDFGLVRWVNARSIKETFSPPTDYRYPFMAER